MTHGKQTPSLANTWNIAHTGEEQVALTGSFKACTGTGSLRPPTVTDPGPTCTFHFPMTTWVQWLKQLCEHQNNVQPCYNIHETLQFFTHDHMQPHKPLLLPNTGWNHISVMALGKLTCRSKQSSIFPENIRQLITLVVHQLIQFKKRFLLFIQAICPHWLRTATALVLVTVSTCHVLPWSFLLANGASFQQVSTWWIKLSQCMPNCISKAAGRWVHLDCSKWLGHLKTNKYHATNNSQKCRLPQLELIEFYSN